MPSRTKKQQKLFQWVKAVQEGKAKGTPQIEQMAKSMSKKDVKDFADYLEEDEKSTMNKTSDENLNKLLQYAAISSLVGSGVAGMYGLSKYFSDKYTLPKRIDSLKEQMNKAKNINFSEEEEKETPPVQSLDNSADLQLVDANEEEKLSSFNKEAMGDLEYYLGAITHGAALPIAAIAPALLSYHFTKKYIDRNRNKRLSKDLDKAKQEFQNILNADSSPLKEAVDNLYISHKQAASPEVNEKGMIDPETGEVALPNYGFSLSLPGLAYAGGSLAGLSGLGAYLMLRKKLRKDPEFEKAKALEKVLRKSLSADALQSGIDISEENGKKVIDLG
jgi:SOS-response transcriptional repressor LexA